MCEETRLSRGSLSLAAVDGPQHQGHSTDPSARVHTPEIRGGWRLTYNHQGAADPMEAFWTVDVARSLEIGKDKEGSPTTGLFPVAAWVRFPGRLYLPDCLRWECIATE